MAGQIFNGNINAMATAWMMVYMVAFAVAWEAVSFPYNSLPARVPYYSLPASPTISCQRRQRVLTRDPPAGLQLALAALRGQ